MQKLLKKSAILFATLSLAVCGVALTACGEKHADGEHTYKWETVKQAKCGEEGLRHGVCDCGDEIDDKIPALEHSWVYSSIEKEATCEESGLATGKCSKCDTVNESIVIPALGHDWEDDYTVDIPATPTGEGSKSIHCSRCGEKKPGSETPIPKLDAETETTYLLRLIRNGMRVTSAVRVAVRDAEGNTVAQGQFRNGAYNVDLLPATYTVVLAGLPDGYHAESSYTITAENPSSWNLVVTASLREGAAPSDTKYAVGSVMYDFTYRTVTGQTVTLSDLLKDKKMVLINFWFVNCDWCKVEFPEMEELFKQYAATASVISVNPIDGETEVRNYAAEMGLTFHVVREAGQGVNLAAKFGVSSYPSNFVVDSEGVIVWGLDGYKANVLTNLFKEYAGGASVTGYGAFGIEYALPEKRED